ncbi:MAG: 2-C-methyl-D-erythritol 2,4-cyclodiphosphate synthase, partial [Pseudoalteromonas distincta]
ADSRALLRHALALVQGKGWKVANVDATIVAQAPKMAPHIPAMRERIAADLQVTLDQVNVKATTTEKLGFVGREEGIAVHAVALLMPV